MKSPLNSVYFFPQNCDALKNFFIENKKFEKGKIRAMVVPHAGYVYSGHTAAMVYSLLRKDYKRVIVIGPNHYFYTEKTVIAVDDYYFTPCGKLKIDEDYSDKLILNYDFVYKFDFSEHSTEVQMPFIKNYLDLPVVELVYGGTKQEKINILVEDLINDDDNLVIISTDLSHFHTLEQAKKTDTHCIEAFVNKDIELMKNCEACGKTGLISIIEASKKFNFKTELINYTTSAEFSGDESKVVGYMSAIVYR